MDAIATEGRLVGRESSLADLASVRRLAGSGALSVRLIEGEAGVGKTALVGAAADGARADGWSTVWLSGVSSESTLAFAGLLGLVTPLHDYLPEVSDRLRDILTAALGWSTASEGSDRFLVGAAVIELLAAAAQARPLFLVVDDVQWLDRESAEALLFAVRRLRHDRLALVLTQRSGTTAPVPVVDLDREILHGLSADQAQRLLGRGFDRRVIGVLVDQTRGNPLALVECGRTLTRAQRAGAAELPDAMPVSDRLQRAYQDRLAGLSAGGWLAARLAAASSDEADGPIVAAIQAAGFVAETCLTEAGEVLSARDGRITFRHPLLRAVTWQRASASDRRQAHQALADVLPDGAARTWQRVSAVVGHDQGLATELADLAADYRGRHSYSPASRAAERAARLTPDPQLRGGWLAAAADDAYLAGDGERAKALAAEGLTADASRSTRASLLTTLGLLEQYSGTVGRARDLFWRAAEQAEGRSLLRTLNELAGACYILDDRPGMAEIAHRAVTAADENDPEQAMLSAYLQGSAAVFAGDVELGAPYIRRAMDLLESEPSLRDDPRWLQNALLCSRWLLDPRVGLAIADRRLAAAREVGALGSLAAGLSLAAGGLAWLGDHVRAYAMAGEAVELLDALGYQVEPGVAHEMFALECAARGLDTDAERSLQRAADIVRRTGIAGTPAHLGHVVLDCALSRGDLETVVRVGEEQIALHGGTGPILEPLGVSPWLVEAYLGLGRPASARELTSRYAAAQSAPVHPYVEAMVARCRGMVAADDDDSVNEFERAVAGHTALGDRAEIGRDRLLYGMRLRRTGRRIAARTQLRRAIEDFEAVQHTAWGHRAEAELAASGERARSRTAPDGAALSSQETRVALLVAQGKTNKEVAAALFLSPKTVEHHLGSALRKRGLRSRTELARDFNRGVRPD